MFNKDKHYSPAVSVGEYTVLNKVGEGRYGITYTVSKGGQQYILKQLKKKMLKVMGIKANYEREILGKVNHPRIPKLIDVIEEGEVVNYILELKHGKTVEEIIYNDNHVFSREEIFKYGSQLIDVIKYLHKNNIVHRDIRVPNIVMNNGEICLLDFGLARWVNGKRYKPEVDFHYLADFLLHLYYTSFVKEGTISKPWYEELQLNYFERDFLERLFGLKEQYINIDDVERDFTKIYAVQKAILEDTITP